VGFTTLLTIYALIGDDLRLICTQRDADPIFDVVVILCLVVFTIECILSCIGKDDYSLSFFFWLDVVSTGSLILDLSYVSEGLQGGDEEGDMSNLRGGRTARVGAKASRVVRVIRLVRILKLYKAYYEAKQRQKERDKSGGLNTEDDEWEDFENDQVDLEESKTRESRVGKKLGEITIRRVIMLVLVMLLVLPLLVPATDGQYAQSALYAADNVYQTFLSYKDTGTATSRQAYENAYLKFFFYHNWFSQQPGCPKDVSCAAQYYAHAFWIGVTGETQEKIKPLAELAHVNMSAVTRWVAENNEMDSIYSYGTMPPEALEILASPWSIKDCDTKMYKRAGISLLKDKNEEVHHAVSCPSELRISERKRIWPRLMTVEEYEEWHFDFYFDMRPFTKEEALVGLYTTGFICLVLCVAAMSFATDASVLVLTPVENMIKRVEEIRENPLIAMKMADEEFKAEEIKKAKARRQGKARCHKIVKDLANCKVCRRDVSEPMETVILEKTIIKLGSLLALGFGEAGANIIGANMRGADSAGVNAMIPGHRVDCILGSVKIRDFSTATLVLKTGIMTFVNQIAEIVHGVVDEYYGAANKNNGDEFLIVWRLEDTWTDEETQRLAEMAVVAFTLILGGLHSSPTLAKYRIHPGLQQRLGSDCRVNLSFGLHCGEAIEGAVGSEFKIDASYLSPNVIVVKSIEQATLIYGVPFIIAESVFSLLSDNMANKIRLIDKVIITGSSTPMTIHSVDLDYRRLEVDRSEPLQKWTSQLRFRARQFLESEKNAKWNRNKHISWYFDKDSGIRVMRKRYTQEFFQHFNMGYQNYYQGEWAVARRMLHLTKMMLEDEDGPSEAILRFMESYEFERPRDWEGVRRLGRTEAEVIG